MHNLSPVNSQYKTKPVIHIGPYVVVFLTVLEEEVSGSILMIGSVIINS